MDHDADLFGPAADLAPIAEDRQNAAANPDFSRDDAEGANYGIKEARALLDHACVPAAYRTQLLDFCLDLRESERLRLGRELHDSTGQLMLALRFSIARLRRAETQESEDIFTEIDAVVGQIDREMRAFAFMNYPAPLEEGGVVDALASLVRGFRTRTGLSISFKSNCQQKSVDQTVAVAALRVTQEALINVHRHACASSVRVTLTEHGGTLLLAIGDDGCGVPPADHHSVAHGVGLEGMRHRVERLGGKFQIRRLKKGTRVTARFPLEQSPPTLQAA